MFFEAVGHLNPSTTIFEIEGHELALRAFTLLSSGEGLSVCSVYTIVAGMR